MIERIEALLISFALLCIIQCKIILARMKFFIAVKQLSILHMGIDFSSLYIAVAKEFLNASQIRPTLQHMRRKAMTQFMGCDSAAETNCSTCILQHDFNGTRSSMLPISGDEEQICLLPDP